MLEIDDLKIENKYSIFPVLKLEEYRKDKQELGVE